MAVINEVFAAGLFIGMAPALGVLGARAADGSDAVLIAWDPVTGDATYSAPVGSAVGGGTRRHVFDRPIISTSSLTVTSITASGAIASGGAVTGLATAGAPWTITGGAGTGAVYLSFLNGDGVATHYNWQISKSNTIASALEFAHATVAGGVVWATPTLALLSDDTAVFAGGIRAKNGSAAAPSYVFAGDVTTGIYRAAAETIGFAAGGGQRATLSATGFFPGSDNGYDIGSTSFRWRIAEFSGNVNAASYTAGGITSAAGWFAAPNAKGLLVQNSSGSNKVAITLDATNIWQIGDGLPVVFSGTAVGIHNDAPRLYLYDTNGTANNRRFDWTVSTNTLDLEARTDAVGFVRVMFSIPHTSGSIQAIGINPLTDAAYDLGSSSFRWRFVTSQYLQTTATGANVTSLLIGTDATETNYRWQFYLTGNDMHILSRAFGDVVSLYYTGGEVEVKSNNSKGATPTRWGFNIRDTTSAVTGAGGGILFSGYKTGTSAVGHFGAIAGLKANGTAGNETGTLRLYYSSSGTITAGLDLNTSTAVFYLSASPGTDNASDLGSTSFRWRDAWVSGNARILGQVIGGRLSLRNAADSGNVGYFIKYMNWTGSGVDETPTITSETGFGIRFCYNGSVVVRGEMHTSGSFRWTGGAYVGATVTAAATNCFEAWNQDTVGNNLWINFYTEAGSGTVRGSIDYNRAGGVTRYNTTSDGTLKTVLGDAPRDDSLYILRNTRLREFYWNHDETRKPQIGPIAQELVRVFKGAVSEGGMRKTARGDDGDAMEYVPWSVDKTAFAWHLLAGWQEHDDRLDALERRVASLTQ